MRQRRPPDLGVRIAGVDGVGPGLQDEVDVLLAAPRPELREVRLVPQTPVLDGPFVALRRILAEALPGLGVRPPHPRRVPGRPGRRIEDRGQDPEMPGLCRSDDLIVPPPVAHPRLVLDIGPDHRHVDPADPRSLHPVQDQGELRPGRRMDVDTVRRSALGAGPGGAQGESEADPCARCPPRSLAEALPHGPSPSISICPSARRPPAHLRQLTRIPERAARSRPEPRRDPGGRTPPPPSLPRPPRPGDALAAKGPQKTAGGRQGPPGRPLGAARPVRL